LQHPPRTQIEAHSHTRTHAHTDPTPAVHDVRTTPAMTQLAATAEFEGYLTKVK